MAYTHFQYIAYQIPTVGMDGAGNAIYGIPPGAPVLIAGITLQGNVTALGTDAQARVQRFINVLQFAYNIIIASGDNSNTLKIFMAPEFYFRPSLTPTRNEEFYTYAEYQAIKDVLRSTIYNDARFNNWLIIPGTIMWKWDRDSSHRPNPLGLKDIYFNSAIYIKGGNFFSRGSAKNEKTEASDIDGIPRGWNKKSPDKMWPGKYETQAKKRKHVFNVGGIQCGLEICLEHELYPLVGDYYGVLKDTLPTWLVRGGHKSIQLHLLITAGMRINPRSVATKLNGFILRNEGLSFPPFTQCEKVNFYSTPPGGRTTEYDVNGKANLTVTPSINTQILIGTNYVISNHPTGDPTFWSNHPQQIDIYPRQPLP